MLPRVAREWPGETAFLVCGGPSVLSVDLDRLRGRRVVAINTSYDRVRWADVLVFTDLRWWRQHRRRVTARFTGRIVTLTPRSEMYEGMLVLERQRSGGLSSDPTRLAWWHTTVTTAINLLVLMGVSRICALGLDGQGGWHHEPHPLGWGRNAQKFRFHAEALEALVAPLADAGVEMLNLNPDSAHRMFPFATLDEVLA